MKMMKIFRRVGAWLAYHPKVAVGVNLFLYPITIGVVNSWYFFSELWREAKSLREDIEYLDEVKAAYKAWPEHTVKMCAEVREAFTEKGERK